MFNKSFVNELQTVNFDTFTRKDKFETLWHKWYDGSCRSHMDALVVERPGHGYCAGSHPFSLSDLM